MKDTASQALQTTWALQAQWSKAADVAKKAYVGWGRVALVISILYTVMFFGTARILANLDGRRVGAFNRSGGKLQTWTGPMDLGSVAGQVLTIPLLLGFFGVAIAIISAIVS